MIESTFPLSRMMILFGMREASSQIKHRRKPLWGGGLLLSLYSRGRHWTRLFSLSSVEETRTDCDVWTIYLSVLLLLLLFRLFLSCSSLLHLRF